MNRENIIGLIPAAGKGSRLGWPVAKELWPVYKDNDVFPVLRSTIDNMSAASAQQIVVIVNHQKPEIMRYLGNGSRFNVSIAYTCQETFPDKGQSPGLSEALNCAYPLIRGKNVILGMPDTIVQPNTCYTSLIQAISTGDALVLGLFPTDRPHRFGMVHLSPEGRVEQIIDKPIHSEYPFMWGILAWSPQFTEHMNEVMQEAPVDFTTVMNLAIKRGLRVTGVVIPGGHYLDLGTIEDTTQISTFFNQNRAKIHSGEL